jgi:hypothetical protein
MHAGNDYGIDDFVVFCPPEDASVIVSHRPALFTMTAPEVRSTSLSTIATVGQQVRFMSWHWWPLRSIGKDNPRNGTPLIMDPVHQSRVHHFEDGNQEPDRHLTLAGRTGTNPFAILVRPEQGPGEGAGVHHHARRTVTPSHKVTLRCRDTGIPSAFSPDPNWGRRTTDG